MLTVNKKIKATVVLKNVTVEDNGQGDSGISGTPNALVKINSNGVDVEASVLNQLDANNLEINEKLVLSLDLITANRVQFFPDKPGVFAMLSDVQGDVEIGSKNNYIPGTLFSNVGEIIYHIEDGEESYYRIDEAFTSSDVEGNTVLENIALDIAAGKITEVEIKKNVVIAEYEAGIFPKGAHTFKDGREYRALEETATIPPSAAWKDLTETREEDVYSNVLEPTIVDGEYNIDETDGKDYFIDVTENTLFNLPELPISKGVLFSKLIKGDYGVDINDLNAIILGDDYDGTILNRFTFHCMKKADGSQINIITIENLE